MIFDELSLQVKENCLTHPSKGLIVNLVGVAAPELFSVNLEKLLGNVGKMVVDSVMFPAIRTDEKLKDWNLKKDILISLV